MSGHGRFSVIGGGGNRPLPVELPAVEDLKPSGDKLGALNIDGGRKDEPVVADTRLDKANRVAAKLDVLLLKAAKTVAKPVDAEALKETTAGLPKATRKAIDKAAAKAEAAFRAIGKYSGCHSLRLPDYIDKELYDRLVAMESGKAREDYIADLRARLSEDQVEVAIQRLDGAIKHAKKLNDNHCVISTADWEKRDVQRKVAGPPVQSLPPYTGTNKQCADYVKDAQKSMKRTVGLFRRHLLAAVAKPGWFEE